MGSGLSKLVGGVIGGKWTIKTEIQHGLCNTAVGLVSI